MRFVPVKTAEQQATALLHRGREQYEIDAQSEAKNT
jgi:transposase